ncbi:MAG: helix-turn-helix transcriptional regulator [Pirellulales bacterium]|nr:helix-turn-helix transcriptional regulator [Pirellulales bacterium]
MKKTVQQTLTNQLRQAVVDSGETLGHLARETGIDKSALSRFVNGHRGLSMEALDALGKHLKLRIVKIRKPRMKKGG